MQKQMRLRPNKTLSSDNTMCTVSPKFTTRLIQTNSKGPECSGIKLVRQINLGFINSWLSRLRMFMRDFTT